jgi:hypothetical protein
MNDWHAKSGRSPRDGLRAQRIHCEGLVRLALGFVDSRVGGSRHDDVGSMSNQRRDDRGRSREIHFRPADGDNLDPELRTYLHKRACHLPLLSRNGHPHASHLLQNAEALAGINAFT